MKSTFVFTFGLIKSRPHISYKTDTQPTPIQKREKNKGHSKQMTTLLSTVT